MLSRPCRVKQPVCKLFLHLRLLVRIPPTHTTLEEQAATKALLVQCLEGSMFETYQPFRDLPLTDENYQRYEQAEESYCDLLRKSPETSQVYEYTSNPYFLLVDIQSLMSNGIFCCQTDQDRAEGCFRMIWMDFSDPTSLQVTDLGIAYPNKGRYLNENIQFIQQPVSYTHLSVSDPTQENKGSIPIELNRAARGVDVYKRQG